MNATVLTFRFSMSFTKADTQRFAGCGTAISQRELSAGVACGSERDLLDASRAP